MRRPAASWLAPLGVALLVLVIVLVVAVTATKHDDPAPTSTDPTLESASTTSSASAPTETSPPAGPSVDFTKAAKKAAKDGFPALVPAEVPTGWVVTDATYTSQQGGPLWQLSLDAPSGGAVVLTQSELSLSKAVQRYLGDGAKHLGRVDLRKFGTGYWFTYSAAGGAGVAKELPTTSVVISAPDEDTAVTLAKQLLTYEDSGSPEMG
jgi:hypothetical protein